MYYFMLVISLICSAAIASGSVEVIPVNPAGDLCIIDGEKIDYQPGDTFAISEGAYQKVVIKNFTGTDTAPVVFRNSGLVRVDNTKHKGGALTISGCKNIRLTGSGEVDNVKNISGLSCGFRVSVGKNGPHAVNVIGKSSNIEIDHIEVCGAGFAGFNVKDEPRKDLSTNRGHFTMYDISIHDNYVHDVTGEGFYIGHTFYDGYYPDGKGEGKEPLWPHVIKGLKVYNNYTVDTGCEGIQVGSAVERCEIYNNTIIRSGRTPFAKYQSNGMQIGTGTNAVVYGNYISDVPDNGMIIFGSFGSCIFNNVITGVGGSGVYISTKDVDGYYLFNNTIYDCKKDGICIGNWHKPPVPVYIYNSIIAADGKSINNQLKTAPLIEKGNLIDKQADAVKFANSQAGDYTVEITGEQESVDIKTILPAKYQIYLKQEKLAGCGASVYCGE